MNLLSAVSSEGKDSQTEEAMSDTEVLVQVLECLVDSNQAHGEQKEEKWINFRFVSWQL